MTGEFLHPLSPLFEQDMGLDVFKQTFGLPKPKDEEEDAD